MSRPPTFTEAFERRQQVRKSGGTPRPVPADLDRARHAFETAIVKSLTANDPAATWDAAVTEAVSQIVAKVFRDAMADVTATGEDPRMTVDEWIAKSGEEIEAAAMAWVARTGQKLSGAEAVSRYLETPEGKKAYARYLTQQEGVAKRYAQARLAPPDGVTP